MKKSILVTGVAGSGKSAVCSEFRRCGYRAYDIEDIAGLFQMVGKKTGVVVSDHDNNNLESVKEHDWVCNIDKLRELIKMEKENIAFYCGTASNIDQLLPLFDKVILLKASPDAIRRRLSGRKSKEFGNTPEIQEWVLSWKDWWEDKMRDAGAVVVDADRDLDVIVTEVVRIAGA